ncbi:MAG TPA: AAA family ATPase, partial [Myxococcota bacterium]|nr:AAA family ATPase [Myxococcota bacterium]
IETVRGRGLRFAPPVTVEGGSDTSFVGRADLLAALEETLDSALAGRGALTLLYGPAGIGKTRMLVEIGARAEARGMRCLRGAGRAGAEGEAFQLWLEAGRELGLDELLRAERGASAGAAQARGAEARRFAQFREVTRVLLRCAEECALLLALDDLQFADADSLALLRYLAPSLHSARIWVLGSFRASALSGGDERLREIGVLAAESSFQVLALRGLQPNELRTLVQNRLRLKVAARAAALLSKRTEGNPLFALEIARSIQSEGGSLGSDSGRALGQELATRIEPLLERRRAALSDQARRLLAAAAAIGVEFEAALIRESERCSAPALERALDEATRSGLLEPAFGPRRRFAHPLVAEGIYGELAARPRAAAAQHLRIAEALERQGCEDPFLVARHLTRAKLLAGPERAFRAALAAAQAASRQSALADAELWYREALSLAEECGRPAPELVGLLLELGEVSVATSGITAARPLLERAARLAASCKDGALLARTALSYAARPFVLAAQEPVLHWLRAANATAELEPSLRARVVSRLGAELAYAGPEQTGEAAQCLEQGLALARRVGDPFTLGRVLVDQTALRYAADDPRGWLSLAEEIVRQARAGRDPEMEFRGLVACVGGHLQLGDRSAAEQALRDCQRSASEHPAIYAVSVTRGVEATFALIDGRLGDARAAIEASESSSSGRGLAAQLVAQRFTLAMHEGRYEPMMPVLESLRAQFPALVLATAAAGLARAVLGNAEPARRALADVVEGLPTLRRDWNRLPTLALAAELAFRARVPDAAAALLPQLAPYLALGAVGSNASIYLGSVAQALGLLEAARGRRRESLELLQRALRAHEELRSPAWCARSARAIEEVRAATRPVRLVS